jgi:hypothetical protein
VTCRRAEKRAKHMPVRSLLLQKLLCPRFPEGFLFERDCHGDFFAAEKRKTFLLRKGSAQKTFEKIMKITRLFITFVL